MMIIIIMMMIDRLPWCRTASMHASSFLLKGLLIVHRGCNDAIWRIISGLHFLQRVVSELDRGGLFPHWLLAHYRVFVILIANPDGRKMYVCMYAGDKPYQHSY